ncbi:carboxypeptidase regulatory-like domain-containing protein [Methanoregula sp.]|uniref:carboxypeptidase regulatory-like domain-containing protein n=1 Tax=Methanoregula sp. TaxID=2052170 RepID=UPI002BB0FFE9|nr:carboxypeptidase regulatory-like domain-containing protein [Methanoregula sp.]HVP97392.1 carboxypeptidase regulatory-like domain-containing protein [Methanoregula sp.]
MNASRIRFLFALLCIIAFCSAVQATNLLITVQDNLDNTTIPHATVFLNGDNVGLTNNAGQFLLQSGQGNLNLLITTNGYDDWAGTIDANTTTLSVTMNRKTLYLNVSLFDSNTLQPVSGATLVLTSTNSSQNTATDTNGAATFGVTAFTYYSLNITAPNYQPRSDTIEVDAANQNVQYWLLSANQYSFIVRDQNTLAPISGATISVNSVLLGTTDSRGVLIAPVSRNVPLTVQIQKTGYQTVNQYITIGTNQAVDAVILTPVPVSGFVFVHDQQNQPISGADVSINGTVVATTTTYGSATLQNLVPGTYAIVVSKAGYTPVNQQIDITSTSSQFPVVLTPATVSQTLYVQDTDQKNIAGATVLLNSATVGTTDQRGELDTQLTYNTTYNITVTHEGYLPQMVKQEISLGNTTTPLTIILQKNMDWGFVTLIGLGILIVLFIYAIIRIAGRRTHHHSTKRNEI